MAKRLSGLARRELIVAVRGRYSASAPSVKREILREFVAITGYHRKSAIRILNDIGEVERDALQLHLAGFDLREIENIVDDVQQIVAGTAEDAHILTLFVVQRRFREKLGNTQQ